METIIETISIIILCIYIYIQDIWETQLQQLSPAALQTYRWTLWRSEFFPGNPRPSALPPGAAPHRKVNGHSYGGFQLVMGVALVIIHFHGIFHEIYHPFLGGTPMTMETSISDDMFGQLQCNAVEKTDNQWMFMTYIINDHKPMVHKENPITS